jgi:hypothetical protein
MATPCNETARELALSTVNFREVYYGHAVPVIIGLARKIAAGTYDETKAAKAWQRVADAGARQYTTEHATPYPDSFGPFRVQDRRDAVADIAAHYAEQVAEMAADMKAGRRNRVTGVYREEPPAVFGAGVFDWSHDVNGNPIALFDIPALGYRAPRRCQVGYGDKISAGVLAYLRDRFPGWRFTIARTYGGRSERRASLDITAEKE